MEEEEHSRYIAQLKAEFDSCDTTATGFLDRDELTALCGKLQLDAHLPLLLDTLLGERTYGRVNFSEFKDGFVAVLSRSLDFSTSEDDSSYLEPAVPDEVQPKFVKGTKRYGRRSRPDSEADAALTCDSEDSPPSRAEAAGSSPAKLRRATSLESVESLKSDEEAGSQRSCKGGHQQEVGGVHQDHLDLQDLLLRRLDADLDDGVSVREFKRVLFSSTPVRSADPQRAPRRSQAAAEERRSASPSLLTATVGQRVLSRLDDGSGCTSPERVAALWTEEGIRNSRDILQTLDFPLEERLSLADLTLALDNELLVSGNGIHQAALISYKSEIQQLQEGAEQACRERDKLRADLEVAERRNLQLVREVDERHASMETLNESRIRDLEQDFRDRLTALRCQSEQESEALLEQLERERRALREELRWLGAQEAELQEELCGAAQENGRLEEELSAVKLRLAEEEKAVGRLRADLNQLLHHKFGGLDPAGAALSPEERISDVIKEYELQCRELRDRNDELSSELELLKSNRKCRRSAGDGAALSWSQQQQSAESDSDSNMKRSPSASGRKKLQPEQKTALSSLDVAPGPAVSIQTELALEQLKQKHQQELQQLNIQLETQVNYYERSLEKMRQSMEVERKDISQAFKLEISELEEQKSEAEQQAKQLKEALGRLQTQLQHGGGWSHEQERRMHRERAELEQNFAREIGNLVQRLSAEKEQLEAELKLRMDQEVLAVREESELRLADARRRLLHPESGSQEAGQSEASLEAELEASRGRCCELEARLGAREHAVASLRAELESRTESVSRLTAELDSLKTDRDRLIQDLKDQAMAVDHLQLELDAASEEAERRRSGEGSLQEALRAEQNRAERLRSGLAEESEEAGRLRQENAAYARLADQLAAQIVEMEAEISTLREHLRGLSAQLNGTADLVLELREQVLHQQRALRDSQNQLRSTEEDLVREQVQDSQNQLRSTEEDLARALLDSQNQLRSTEEDLARVREQVQHLQRALRDSQNQLRSTEEDLARALLDSQNQLRSREEDLARVREQVLHLQGVLLDSQNQLRSTEEDLAREKSRMAQQLMELERLVLDLEGVMEAAGPHRTRLEEVRLENGALQERLSVLQQEVQNLEDDVAKKRRRLEEVEKEHERSREEEERLQQENARYREEVLDLSSRNLQLSGDNGELSTRLRGEQEAVLMLRGRLATASLEQEEAAAGLRRRLQDAVTQHEREKLQRQAAWTQERQLLEAELCSTKEELEAELSGVSLKLQWTEEDKERLRRDGEERNRKVEQQLSSVETEAELLRSQLHAVTQEKLGHAQEVAELQSLRVQNQELQSLRVQNQELQSLRVQNQELQSLRVQNQELQSLRVQNQEAQNLRAQNQELQGLRVQNQELQVQVHQLTREQQNLRTSLREVEATRAQAQDQAQRAGAALSALQAGSRKEAELLQERADDLEVQLKALRLVLQEKVQQLKQQLAKSSQTGAALKELYVENAQLMAALQVTERRQKHAEKKSALLEDKVGALNQLLRQIVPAALAT
ncbi:ninein-like protein isoform 2-T2 [Odontesthes bonariensis]|uniref:ninein-like protein isoform X2 n=1 Tax=Odontesthes bonariensis TaxID=219752 RepID=UPI003F58106E